MDFKKYIKDVQNFPQQGVTFKDITPLLKEATVFHAAIDEMSAFVKEVGATTIVAPEARGFIFSSPLAYATNSSLVLIRKSGKLPKETKKIEYSLEYGSNSLELQKDDLHPGEKVVIVDDILATGGTIDAIIKLVEDSGAIISGICFLADITGLNSGTLEKKYKVKSLIKY